ncbi:MAG: DUF1638 domain-containing protein [Deltaproteobacteria bacterium]|jgi:hypothetical protein|nr:DUF1638 domain-containing protein [Deltaproteobacteria bacterium]
MQSEREKRIVVGCGIFEAELRKVLEDDHRFDYQFHWLKSGYHARMDLLASKLSESLEDVELADLENLRILYGGSCLFDVDEAVKKGLKILPSDNCLTAMVGRNKLREMEKGRTMVVTSSWIRKIYLVDDEDEFPLWSPEEMRMNLGRYDRILVLDAGVDEFSDEEILTAFDRMGVVLEFEKCSLNYFRGLIYDFMT